MRNLLTIEGSTRSASAGIRPRWTAGPVLLSVLLGGVLTMPAMAEKPRLPVKRPGILIVPRRLAPVPQPRNRVNVKDRPAPVRQLAYTAAAAPTPKKPPLANTAGIVIAPAVDHTTYAGAYGSIPFSRAEFDANPSYRHEAAMEILFGKLRPMVVHKYVPQANPPRFSFDNYGSYPFGSSLRNYNFYYPRPTIYQHY